MLPLFLTRLQVKYQWISIHIIELQNNKEKSFHFYTQDQKCEIYSHKKIIYTYSIH